MSDLIEVKIIYFKESGKYYTEGSFFVRDTTFYSDIIKEVRYWSFTHNEPLPGLSCTNWDGYAVVTPQSEKMIVPCLVDWTIKNENLTV